MEKKTPGITAGTLKWIAVITMLIDHYGLAIYAHTSDFVYEYYKVMRYIGRISFPIYCFLLIEGFYHTRNVGKYIGRCLIFGFLSEIPYNMALSGSIRYSQMQNVFFTLAIGLATIYFLERIKYVRVLPESMAGKVNEEYVRWGISLICVTIGAGLAQVLDTDYHYIGILLIVAMYFLRNLSPLMRCLGGAAAFSFEITAPIAFIPIYFYNGERGKQIKNLYYLIYPLHLLVYGLIRIYVL